MAQHERFHLKTAADLKNLADRLKITLPISEDISPLLEKVTLAGCTLPNRFAVHPMEGFDAAPDGTPQALSFRRYKRYAAGGSGLIWFEATAVVPEGRTNSGQFMLTSNNIDVFKQLVEETRKTAHENFGINHSPLLILQITHSGRYCKKNGKPNPLIAHRSPILDPLHKLGADYPVLTDEYLDNLQLAFVEAACLAKEAGFDGVDIKSCHRYLISELLASFTRENSRYGGSFENRTRFLLETAAKIKSSIKNLIVTSRLNLYDAIRHPYGWGVNAQDEMKWDLTEPVRLIKQLRDIDYPILNISIANPYFNPHHGRPFDFPVVGANPPEMHPLEGIARFLQITSEVQRAHPDLPVIGSGYSWLRHLFPYVAAGVVKGKGATLIGQGRGAFAYPDSVKDIMKTGKMDPRKACVACSACTQIMRDGGKTGCVVRDSEIYAPFYRNSRKNAEDHLKAEAARCRDCEFGNCQSGCPANVDVPGFIKAFERGEIHTAYDILKKNNVLPELCAHVCPADVQCEKMCIEGLLKGRPVPIRDIQRFIAKQAREKGCTSITLPANQNEWKVAVVGAGPAGLACTISLLEQGFEVDLYDKQKQLGGTPLSVIPSYRLALQASLAETEAILSTALAKKRLTLIPDFELSKQHPLESIQSRGYAALFLGMGLGKAQGLPAAKRPAFGVVDALAFLMEAKISSAFKAPARVAVLGAGNTAMDAALTAKRFGSQDVYIVYRRSFEEMPAWPKERDEALENGVHFLTLSQPVSYQEAGGKVTGLVLARTLLGESDSSGRRAPEIVPNSETTLPVDLVIEALGQNPVEDLEKILPSIERNKKGFIKVGCDFQTSLKGVYAGGDLVNGGTTAVQAVAEGMKAAYFIGQSFSKRK